MYIDNIEENEYEILIDLIKDIRGIIDIPDKEEIHNFNFWKCICHNTLCGNCSKY